MGVGMFTGGAIWILTHGHMGGSSFLPDLPTVFGLSFRV